MATHHGSSLLKFWTPRYWPVWLSYGLMRAIVLLPLRWQIGIGKRFGRLISTLAPQKRRIAQRNLEVCFPELSEQEVRTLCGKHFESMGAGLAETAMGWFGSKKVIREAVRIEGGEHLETALTKGQGVVLFCGHVTTLEFYHAALSPLCGTSTLMYRHMRNPMMNEIMCRGRSRNIDQLFANYTVRRLLKSLAENSMVYYMGDQAYGRKYSALIPFFGEPAMTNTAVSRIVRMSGATLLICLGRRSEDGSRYSLNIIPPPEDFPTDDPARDTGQLMKVIEDYVRTCPEQYVWTHRRFKARPEGYPDIYADTGRPHPGTSPHPENS